MRPTAPTIGPVLAAVALAIAALGAVVVAGDGARTGLHVGTADVAIEAGADGPELSTPGSGSDRIAVRPAADRFVIAAVLVVVAAVLLGGSRRPCSDDRERWFAAPARRSDPARAPPAPTVA